MFDDIECNFDDDDDAFFKFIKSCKTYEELRVQCDIHEIECIMTEVEFNDFKYNEVYCNEHSVFTL